MPIVKVGHSRHCYGLLLALVACEETDHVGDRGSGFFAAAREVIRGVIADALVS